MLNGIRELQDALTNLGYFFGHPDSIFQGDTVSALKKFQSEFASTGILDKDTLERIDTINNFYFELDKFEKDLSTYNPKGISYQSKRPIHSAIPKTICIYSTNSRDISSGNPRVSSNYVIDPDGNVFKQVSSKYASWHVLNPDDSIKDLTSLSIFLENPGELTRVENGYVDNSGLIFEGVTTVMDGKFWTTFKEIQMNSLKDLCKKITAIIKSDNILFNNGGWSALPPTFEKWNN